MRVDLDTYSTSNSETEVRHFQSVFSLYFPALSDLAKADFVLMELRNRIFWDPIPTVRRSQAKRDLQKAAAALRSLASYDVPCWTHLWSRRKEDENGQQDVIMQLLSMFVGTNWRGSTDAVIDRFVTDVEAGIERLPEAGNIKWDGVHAVMCLCEMWEQNTGKYAPRSLNPASKFASFLQDGFKFLEIEADPVSAFKRWRAKVL
jgi:hypothetical protein